MGFVQDGTEDLLDSHRHLPVYPLLFLGCPFAPAGRAAVPVPAGSVPQHIPDCIKALLAQHFYETGNTSLLYLFSDVGAELRRLFRYVFEGLWSV
jgi:hypothetical protein